MFTKRYRPVILFASYAVISAVLCTLLRYTKRSQSNLRWARLCVAQTRLRLIMKPQSLTN